MFTRPSLAALIAAPLLALAGPADAQVTTTPYVPQTGSVKPLPVPAQHAFTSIAVHNDVDLAQIPGVDIMLEPEGGTRLLATTGSLGATEFYQLRNGTVVDTTLQETPIDGGVALGIKTRFQVQVEGKGMLSYSKQLTQPTAHSVIVDDDGANEQRVFPKDRDFPFWDINVVPKSGVKFDADVGMLVNKEVVQQVLDYYGYPYDSGEYTRGLFMRVNTPGGAKLGDDGVGLVMHNFGESDYNKQQLDVVHFAASGNPVPTDSARTAAPLVSNFVVSYKYLDSEPHALYYLGGDMPEGYTMFLWRDGKVSDYSEVVSVPLDTPEFEGNKDLGIDLVDLSGEVPVYSANGCSDCTPPGVTTDPNWQCTPPGVSGWTKFWWFGCPGDGDKVGGIQCKQWYIPVTPIFCNSDGNIQLCVKRSATLSVKIGIDGGEVGSSVTIEKSTCLTADIEPGENGCGECVRMWGVGLICAQEYSNHDDVTCNSGGYCFGTTWTKDCYEYDPVITKCTDSKVTVTRCSRG